MQVYNTPHNTHFTQHIHTPHDTHTNTCSSFMNFVHKYATHSTQHTTHTHTHTHTHQFYTLLVLSVELCQQIFNNHSSLNLFSFVELSYELCKVCTCECVYGVCVWCSTQLVVEPCSYMTSDELCEVCMRVALHVVYVCVVCVDICVCMV